MTIGMPDYTSTPENFRVIILCMLGKAQGKCTIINFSTGWEIFLCLTSRGKLERGNKMVSFYLYLDDKIELGLSLRWKSCGFM